jgi:hypothetical protein
MQIVAAAMRKLVHLVYGVLKSGKPFDPEYAKAGTQEKKLEMNITSSDKGGRQPPLSEPNSSCADSMSKSNNQRLTFNTASVGFITFDGQLTFRLA